MGFSQKEDAIDVMLSPFGDCQPRERSSMACCFQQPRAGERGRGGWGRERRLYCADVFRDLCPVVLAGYRGEGGMRRGCLMGGRCFWG